ncbi:MarR family winged helix-turn-helix transcriptional regulator [Streptomyces sp. HPF1205]|uniref:MarR family winged helix-turn-helix transcriptional regulator n=1 Tax=Streptomyces sp. HPF1205 TaxID=2873262 RepID=UPI001CED4248|nr:MarR family transcriptional regulator [Streptomyces sp. HPF1205]
MPTESRAEPRPWREGLTHVLWRAHQAAQRRVQESLTGLGVTLTQLALAANVQEHGPLSAADLARALRVTPQTVTVAMNQLVELGWLTRRPHPVHKRVQLFELTPGGTRGVDEGRALVAKADARMTGALEGGDAEEFIGQLRRIVAELEGDDPPVAPLWPERVTG